MPGLTFSSVFELDVLVAGAAREAPTIIGGADDRAFSGNLRPTERARKSVWRFRTPPLSQPDAECVRGLLGRAGHVWSFDSDLYSSRGLGPNSGHTATQGGTGKYGARVSLAAGTSLVYNVTMGTRWTVSVYRKESGTWNHYVVRYDGTTTLKWVNGSSNNGATTTWLTVTSTTVTIAAEAGSATEYDELIALPFLLISSWALALSGATAAFSDLPKLSASGDLIPYGPTTVIAQLQGGSYSPAHIGGVWCPTAESVEFMLEEL